MTHRAKAPGRSQGGASRRRFYVGLALLLGVVGTVSFLLWPRREPTRGEPKMAPPAAEVAAPYEASAVERAAPPATTTPSVAAPAPPSAPSALPPLDLFAAEAPEILSMGHQVVERGGILSSARLKEVFQFGREHPGDARAYLLMGADSMNRGWLGFAVDHYVRAQKEDPRARQDPRMLRDLVAVAADEHYATQGVDAVTRLYGSSAVGAVEDAIVEAGAKGDMARVQRLTDLSRSLVSPPR